MKIDIKSREFLLILLGITLIVVALISPLNILEYLSLEVVGEPPINGRTWLEGVYELGGEYSMKFLAIVGVIIIICALFFVLDWETKPIPKREAKGNARKGT